MLLENNLIDSKLLKLLFNVKLLNPGILFEFFTIDFKSVDKLYLIPLTSIN